MKVGLISDTHGATEYLEDALRQLRERGVQLIIHCGDVTAPKHLTPILAGGWELHLVYGNMDRRRRAFPSLESEDGLRCHGESGWVERDGKRIGFTHGNLDSTMRQLRARSPDYLVRGHTHERKDVSKGDTRIINPGSVKPPGASAAVLDLETDRLTFLDLQPN